MTKPQRAITLILAVLFLATSVAFTVLVVIEMNKNNDDTAEVQDQTAEDTNEQQLDQPQGETLQGTKLENFEPVANVEKLQIIDIKEGTGEVVKEGATVTAHYTGAIASTGIIFQSSRDFGQPIPFSLTGVIEGWTEGVPGMKVGGVRRLIIPAEQAYGSQSPSADIPANSDLVFDIEVTATE